MRYQTIVLSTSSARVELPSYVFRMPDNWPRWQWMERLLRYCWFRLAAPFFSERTHYHTVNIDGESWCDLIAESQQRLRMIAGSEKCRHVIVGPKQFSQLSGELYNRFSFPVNMTLQERTGGEMKVFGLTIHCIPWFDGMLLLPDLNEIRSPNAAQGRCACEESSRGY